MPAPVSGEEEEVIPCEIYGKYADLQRLVLAIAPKSVPEKKGFLWTDLNINWLDKSLISNIEKLYQDVVIGAASDHDTRLADFFSSLAASPVFQDLWAGERRGPFLLPVPFVRNLLTLDQIQHGLGASTGRKPCESALTLTDGVDFRCPISLPPIRQMSHMLEVLLLACTSATHSEVRRLLEISNPREYGTIFLNTASLHWKAAAQLCLAASCTLHFPCNINVYVTGRNRKVSTDVHTDNHDVLIFHTQGAKRWRVYAPPTRASRVNTAHPLYRGKNEDRLLEDELGELLLDVILQPGQVLFVPMGFPHATGTAGTGDEVSVHLTLGLSTADYDFCWGGLRKSLLQNLGQTPSPEDGLSDRLWWRLLSPLPVGFLAQRLVKNARLSTSLLVKEVGKQLLDLLHAIGELDSSSLPHLEHLVAQHFSRQVAVLASQEEAYREVLSRGDGVFLAAGPEETKSDYRRSMLRHQIAEDERKRCVDNVSDPRYVKRIDFSDGVARSLAELTQRLQGASSEEIQIYWEKCPSLYPQDQPPLELLGELQRASDNCEALLYFLRKRTPQLRTVPTVAMGSPSQHVAGHCLDTNQPKCSGRDYPKEWVAVD